MLDFLIISTRKTKRDTIEIYPKFVIKHSTDLMIRGGDFYAIWIEERGLWSTSEQDALQVIDAELDKYVCSNKDSFDGKYKVLYMWDSENGMIDKWHKYCQKHMRDSFNSLDERLIFSNTVTTKKDFASKKLAYPLEPCAIDGYNKLMSTLYTEEERHKIEWAIGSIVSGDSKNIQKFMVLYGSAGTGKSTVLNIIQEMFEGYYSVFDAKALGSSSNSFALESFKSNPLIAIQHDGDLSKIEDNTRLNSLVSHELMTVNEKFKAAYSSRFNCFLFMGTNKPVKITDGKSGLIRRLIDVSPSGNTLNIKDYEWATNQVSFELGGIACHCLDVYKANPKYYNGYIPTAMLGASNDFYNFMIDGYHIFKHENGITLKSAWEMYKTYCEDAKVPYPYSQRNFKEELKNYFNDFDDRFNLEDGSRVRSYYSGFRTDKFENTDKKYVPPEPSIDLLNFEAIESILDNEYGWCSAQYATTKETPSKKWDEVTTKLSDLDTSNIHYVMLPENHIVIDFDLKDEDGNKSFELNLQAASKWPRTYAELSKSGGGIHLHYIYKGDASKLSRLHDEDIEVKVFTGNSSLRRKLTKCTNTPIATISSGLKLKGEKKMVNGNVIKSEKGLREMIKRNLDKEIHPSTKCSVDFIHNILEDAYDKGLVYDVSDMKNAVIGFAAGSSHQAEQCLKLVNDMKFMSEKEEVAVSNEDSPIIMYDVEVFPNLFLVNWKKHGSDMPVVRLINPTPSQIEALLSYRLVGFNCRRYDNHIMYARLMGYDNMQLYNLSQRIVSGDKKAFFREAYNLSYTDVYDFSTEKKSLKKWEIELGIHHHELGLPWDQPVDEALWPKVAEYCDDDVIATEKVFDNRQADFMARQIQVDLVKMMHGIDACVNDTTNTLSQKIVFGNEKNPQSSFNWRDLSKPVGPDQFEEYKRKFGDDYIFRVFNADGYPLFRDYIPGEDLPEGYSILPFFKGYTYEFGKSTYLGEVIGEGGRVYSEPGMYGGVWDGDIASQHPHSAIYERVFGPKYTKIFEEIVQARVAIKHKDFDRASKLLGGALIPYLNEEQAPALAQALKIVINSIYGLTSASFMNAFRDPNNIDNIVAKRGALFMTMLKAEVQKMGYTVAHIKTDSIKIPDADDAIIKFVTDFGREFGYTFETEANFDKFCIVNDAVYVAKFKDGKHAGEWTATGTQFKIPYVFKSLFSKEKFEFEDFCETKSVMTALYLDLNEQLEDVSDLEKELFKLETQHKKGLIDDDTFEITGAKLIEPIAAGHSYRFVGKVGNFCPVKPGCGGGLLMREKDGKYYSATGAKGYRWLESEMVRDSDKDIIDRRYYDNLVDEAVKTISEFGDFEQFVSDEPYVSPIKLPDFMNIPEDTDDEEIPFAV